MKKIFLLCSILLSLTISAQLPSNNNPKTGVVYGKVIDASSQQAIPYVTIIVKDAAKKPTTGGITDDNGNFSIKQLSEGKNFIEIQFIGYKTEIKEINISKTDSRIDLGTIYLKEEASQLNEVVVVAETSTVSQKIDRKVINVGKDLTAAGTTASELLNNVQSVSVDSQTGNISLRGNENVRVLVDGKPTNIDAAQLLKQIPSTSIKSVELITNPSAKYNPEGMSGIINIVLHKNSNIGFNGSANTGLTMGKNNRFNGSLDMNFKTGKVNFFANYGINDGKSENYGIVERNDNNSVQNFDMLDNSTSHLLKVGADIYINEKNTFSFYTTQNMTENIFNGDTRVTFDNILDSSSPMLVNGERNSQAYNFNYTLDFEKKGHSIEFEANFSDSDSPESADYKELVRPFDLTSNYNDIIKNERGTRLYNIDYTNPLSENSKLELGLEARFNETTNNNITTQHEFIYDSNNELINDGNGWYETKLKEFTSFDYNRDIYAGYVNYNQQINKVSMQLGARFEQYNVEGSFVKGSETLNYSDKIFSVYPSAFFTYNPSEKNQFQLSYSRRVDRPSIGQVNPIREWSTPLITSVGNPNLKPQFTNSYEFNYTKQHNKGSFTIGTFYRRVNDNINRTLNIDPLDEDKVELSFNNTASNDRYGFEVSSNYKVAKWWRTNASFDLYTQKESGLANGEQIEVTNNTLNFRLSNSFTATKNLRFQLFAMYRGGGKSIQFKVDPMWMINTGASLNVLKGKGTISLRVNDIFEGMKFKFESENPYPYTGQFNWESRTAYLGFMYRFGGGKNKAKGRKSRDNNETQSGGGFI
ncbi:outer membrane receptor protein involved in Fe transport [Lutibacter oceani]|uniref:Outer membrane receptor protein involved in Fe transport n=1 Tax=Lutibacter oceani TaxID=1853311 RepID=A0A3D9S228_9FLAO|nr:outer membrane beta-barrel family protein [Lutibacter oceani]REE82915.1 outer membrane receptor protein involved in Fe transport [Lutibacter oceani]